MIIKKYRADNLEEAKRIVEAELGPEAIVLTTRPVKEKGLKSLFFSESVEVTAAIGESELKLYQSQKNTTGKFKKGMLKKTSEATKDRGVGPSTNPEPGLGNLGQNLEDLKKTVSSITTEPHQGVNYGDQVILSSQARQQAKKKSPQSLPTQTNELQEKTHIKAPIETIDEELEHRQINQTQKAQMPESFNDLSRRLVQEFSKTSEAETEPIKKKNRQTLEKPESPKHFLKKTSRPKVEVKGIEEKLNVDLETIRRVIREEFTKAQRSVNVGKLKTEQDNGLGSVPFLISKGVSRSIAVSIQEGIEARLGPENPRESKSEKAKRLNTLKMEIASRIKSSGPILLRQGEPTVVSLVGPTGVGKTTTLMKIAEQYTKELEKKVGVITLDLEKVGALEQIQAMARSISVSCQYAENGLELKRAISNFNDRDLILIDTGGRSQYNWKELDDLIEILGHIEGIHNILTISATTKDVDVYGIIQQFVLLNVESLIFTKLDETIGFGILLNACDKMHLPISYLSTGKQGVENLIIANDSDLARRLLVENNSKKYKYLRQVAAV